MENRSLTSLGHPLVLPPCCTWPSSLSLLITKKALTQHAWGVWLLPIILQSCHHPSMGVLGACCHHGGGDSTINTQSTLWTRACSCGCWVLLLSYPPVIHPMSRCLWGWDRWCGHWIIISQQCLDHTLQAVSCRSGSRFWQLVQWLTLWWTRDPTVHLACTRCQKRSVEHAVANSSAGPK